ncbi:MAG: ComF family protein [Ardenticatenaceae bacterium]|nr:ComF family protein [Anaerolineales bacterium]MCB8923439.1 ComF family protein [Ardenticatenaceae bacterium]MCB8991406.1 ComF family protein [Ardenticatenaceae bacterium]MCB9003836.1 ComF family protein [Ardenticatenaceae bacterium]
MVEPLCERCGRPLSHSAPHCYACTQRPFPLQQVRTAVFFEDPIQTLIHKLKYSNTFALASALAAFMLQAWPDWASPINCIIPIPLHEKRYKERGYNQSERLAHYLSHERHIWMDTHSLQRTRHTQPQVHLNAVERQSNVAGAFSVTDTDIVNKHILLIDDVFTTGATLSAAADVLLTAGAATVSGYCLARAK